MKLSRLLLLSAFAFAILPAATLAQRPPAKPNKDPSTNGGTTKDKPKPKADLAADSITAKWKNATTLLVTGIVKNTSTINYTGNRTAKLSVTFADGKNEVVKDAVPIPDTVAGKTAEIMADLTDKKYFAKDLKWTLEISEGDDKAANDKKTVPLNLPMQPKA